LPSWDGGRDSLSPWDAFLLRTLLVLHLTEKGLVITLISGDFLSKENSLGRKRSWGNGQRKLAQLQLEADAPAEMALTKSKKMLR
jgi:hypothetical protein